MKVIFIFIPVFIIVFVLNQFSYGACFKGYCLEAAFPKVAFISLVISLIVFFISKENDEKPQKSIQKNNPFLNQDKICVTHEAPQNTIYVTHEAPQNTICVTRKVPQMKIKLKGKSDKLKYFETYKEAAVFAKELSNSLSTTIKLGVNGNTFFVYLPMGYEAPPIPIENELTSPSYDEYDEYADIEQLNNQNEIIDELWDSVASLARSDEDGWYYEDIDPGMENNVIDKSYE
ncbi:hypothetical protein [Pseudoalteromonas undina]|uniref:hypothetical protein n=1 Tax=Pseudoalteromonas undina TaxID=43660 RepID=UPI001868C4D2|nr:hypothetical protein [Pseudoalteromonas undina]